MLESGSQVVEEYSLELRQHLEDWYSIVESKYLLGNFFSHAFVSLHSTLPWRTAGSRSLSRTFFVRLARCLLTSSRTENSGRHGWRNMVRTVPLHIWMP